MTNAFPPTTPRTPTAQRAARLGRLSAMTTAILLAGCAITPAPMDWGTALKQAQDDQKTLTDTTQAPAQRLTLVEAMSRALLHNRERRVQMMESAMASSQLAVSRFDMLPQLAANAGYTERSTVAASSSAVFDPVTSQFAPATTPTYSVSAGKVSQTRNLALSWNVLDFGLSYLRAHQNADRLLIAQERERKAVHNLIQDVRTAYWRAVSAQKLLDRTVDLRERVKTALVDARRIEELRLKNPLEALTYQRDLIDARRSLESLHKDLQDARTTLATLIGLPPSTPLELETLADDGYRVPTLRADMQTLERSALALRPELMELRYQKRISEAEGRAALLGLLPSLNLTAGAFRDSNDFLYYNDWNSHGATLGLNLFNVLKAPAVKELGASQKRLTEERRLALTAAVLGQVHLSRVALANANDQFQTSDEYLQVIRKIRNQMQQMRNAQRTGELELIREEMAELLAELRKDVAYAELQNSYGRVFVSAGLDPLPTAPSPLNIDTLSQAMTKQLQAWDQGQIGLILNPLSKQVQPWQGPGNKQLQVAPDTFSLAGQVKFEARQRDGAALPHWLKFDPLTQTFSGNPPAGQDRYAIELSATDAAGARITDRFELQLDAVNDAPTAGATKRLEVREGSPVRKGKLEAVDADGDTLTFALGTWQQPVPGFTFTPDGHWTFDPTGAGWENLKAGAKREAAMRFTATDPHGGQGSLDFVVEVTGTNNPPHADTPSEVGVGNNGPRVEGRIQASDVDDGAQLTFALLGDRATAGFTLGADGRWQFNPQDPAYAGLRLSQNLSLFIPIQITDDAGGMAVVRLQINITGTQP